jgi:hypothetical protein
MIFLIGLKVGKERRNMVRLREQKLRVVDSVSDLFRTGIKELDELPASKEFFALLDNNRNSSKQLKSVYVIEFKDDSLKIGVSINPQSRIRVIEKQSGRKVSQTYITDKTENAFSLETNLKNSFSNFNLEGEFYECDFESVVDFLKLQVKRLAVV